MNVENLVFFYMGVCLAMILFNCVVMLINVLRKKQTNRTDRKLEQRIDAQLERLQRGEAIEKDHLAQMDRVFKKLSHLRSFENSLDVLKAEKPKLCQKYLEAIRPCFVRGAADYFKRDMIEATYFTWLVRKYDVADEENGAFWRAEMRKLLQTSSIYCRENALHILYHMGNAAEVVNALLQLDGRQIFHHSKLIHDGMLEFAGDKEALLKEIWNAFDRFSASMQVTLLSYMRLTSAQCREKVFEVMMRPNQDDEVYFACMRYFGKMYDERVFPVLLDALRESGGQRWERAAIAASVLRTYPSERTTEVLMQALHSSNWYVRNNAAETLESFGLTYAKMAEVFEGNDRYAREILQYWMDYRAIKEGEVGNDDERMDGCA